MLNVKTLTDTMSRMTLPELQQYAALHKTDPYVVTLALSIANQKKQMQTSMAGQAGMMPQPKVVDQDIAQMVPSRPAAIPQQAPAAPQQQTLPEDVGIGQLPAQTLQGMAGGGIVAFDGGGEVPGFAGPTGSYIGTTNEVPDGASIMGNMYQDPDTGEWKPLPGVSFDRQQYTGPKLSDLPGAIRDFFLTPAGQRKAAIADKNKIAEAQNRLLAQNYVPRRSEEQQFASEVAKRNNQVDPTATTATNPVVNPVPSGLPPSPLVRSVQPPAIKAAPVSAGSPTLNTKAMTAEEAVAANKQFGDESALTSGIERLRSDALKTNEDVQSAYEKGLAALPKPGAEAEARLKQREAEDAVGQADAKALAIFKAGLGMLAGTSPNAFENIGKGALAGLEDYSASIKEFRKLGMERDKAYADIEAARNAAARDDFKTSINLQERAADRLAKVDEKGIDVTATLFKTNKETAAAIYRDSFDQAQANARTMATEAGATNRALIQERGANARAQMQSPLNLYTALGNAPEGSPLLKGYNIAKNEPQMSHLYESYNKQANDMMAGPAFRAQFPTFDAYVKEFQRSIGASGGSGFVQPPPNAAVLKPK